MDLASFLPFVIKASIVLLVLGLGLRATWTDALYLFRERSLLLRSVLSMNVVMPLVAAALVVAFDLPLAVKIALVALALSPVPPILPRKEVKAGGDAAYAIGLLVAIAVLAIITVPLGVTWFSAAFDRNGEISPLVVAKVVFSSVLAPLAVGIAVRQWAPVLAEKIAQPVALLGNALLILSALPLAIASWPDIHALFGNGTVLMIAFMAVLGLIVGHWLGGPRADDRTVLALSTASRHPAVALAIAVSGGLATKPVLAAILLYLVVAGIVSIPYVVWRRRQAIATHTTARRA